MGDKVSHNVHCERTIKKLVLQKIEIYGKMYAQVCHVCQVFAFLTV